MRPGRYDKSTGAAFNSDCASVTISLLPAEMRPGAAFIRDSASCFRTGGAASISFGASSVSPSMVASMIPADAESICGVSSRMPTATWRTMDSPDLTNSGPFSSVSFSASSNMPLTLPRMPEKSPVLTASGISVKIPTRGCMRPVTAGPNAATSWFFVPSSVLLKRSKASCVSFKLSRVSCSRT